MVAAAAGAGSSPAADASASGWPQGISTTKRDCGSKATWSPAPSRASCTGRPLTTLVTARS
nr:K435 [uncultured bacterium]